MLCYVTTNGPIFLSGNVLSTACNPGDNSRRLEIARLETISKSTPVNPLSLLICLLGQGLLPGEGRPFHQGRLAQNLELLS